MLPGPLFIVITGRVNVGKTRQITSLLSAKMPGGAPAVQPTLFLAAETSSEGTAGDLLHDPSVVVWPVKNCTEASAVLATCFPDGRAPLTLAAARTARAAAFGDKKTPPPAGPLDTRPLGSIAVDSFTTLYGGQKALVREQAIDERVARGGRAATIKRGADAIDLDERTIAALSYGPIVTCIDQLSGIATRNRGLLVVCACHTTGLRQTMTIGEGARKETREVVIGEVPNLGSTLPVRPGIQVPSFSKMWDHLAAKANWIVHLFSTEPDFEAMDPALINAGGVDAVVKFGAITTRGKFPGLGPVSWTKRQDGEGWLQWFAAAPAMWHTDVPWDMSEEFAARVAELPSGSKYQGGPDLGLLLELCLHDAGVKT